MPPKVSIIVPAHNEEEFLAGLLRSLQECCRVSAEIIVVDNGSQDGTAQIARQHGCKLVSSEIKLFPSTARNKGVKEATGDILVFLDADVEITSSWGEELAAQITTIQSKPWIITGDQYHVSKKPSWIERNWFALLRSRAPKYLSGGNLITTRAVFEALHGFDETLETGEDVDLCKRGIAKEAALKINNSFAVYHEGYPKTIGRFVRRERWHGKGDFRSVRDILRSPVALAALAFVGLHFAITVSLVRNFLRHDSGVVTSMLCITLFAVCVIAAAQKFGRSGLIAIFRATPIMYLYYCGRALAAFDVLRKGATSRRRG